MGKAKRKRAERRVPQTSQRRHSVVWRKSMESTHVNMDITYSVEGFEPYDRVGRPGFFLSGSVNQEVELAVGAHLTVHLPECPYGDSFPYDVGVEEPTPEPLGADSFDIVYRCPACGESLGLIQRDVNLVLDPEIAKQPLIPPAEPKDFGPTDASDIFRVSDVR